MGGCEEVVALTGPAGSGKTAALVARVAELLGRGVPAAEVLLVCPGHDGALNLGRRLHEELGDAARDVRVASARAFELGVIEAVRGSAPRVLLDVEQSVLVADLKAAGVDGALLTGLLDRAGACWGEGRPLPVGSDAGFAALEEALRRRGATVPQALAWQAKACLEGRADDEAPLGAPYVLVDDANALSPAACAALRLAAGRELVMAGDPTWGVRLFDGASRPDAFVEAAARLEALAAPAHALRAPERSVVKWLNLEEEVAGTVATVARKTASCLVRERELGVVAADGDGLPPFCAAQTVVVVPDRAHASSVVRALAAREIPASQFLARQPVGGDPRRPKACADLAAFTALGLLADGRDAASWRTWLALGRPDLASGAWCALEAWAAERGWAPVEALGALADGMAGECASAPAEAGPFPGAAELAEGYARGRELIGRYGTRRGFGLLKAVGASAALMELCEPLGGEEDAATVFAQLGRNLVDRRFGSNPAAVRVGCPESLVGMEPLTVIAVGCNEGLVPAAAPAEDPAAFASASKGLAHALACARETLVASYAQRCPVEAADKLGARYRRTRRDGDEVLAVLAPSPVLAGLGADVPSTLSGQQYTAAVLGMRS